MLAADPLRAREALRAVFEEGRIAVYPQPDGSYVAEGTFLPLVAIADPAAKTQRRAARGADADGGLEKVVAVQMKVVVAKTPDRRKKR